MAEAAGADGSGVRVAAVEHLFVAVLQPDAGRRGPRHALLHGAGQTGKETCLCEFRILRRNRWRSLHRELADGEAGSRGVCGSLKVREGGRTSRTRSIAVLRELCGKA